MYKNNCLCKNTKFSGPDRSVLIYFLLFLKSLARYLHYLENGKADKYTCEREKFVTS